MKLPKYIACSASYFDDDPSKIVMYSLVVVRSKDNAIILSRTFGLDSYTDDDACDELDSIIGDFKNKNESIDVVFGNEPIKLIRQNSEYVIKMITADDYKNIIRYRKNNVD